jgi:hypothetical protein
VRGVERAEREAVISAGEGDHARLAGRDERRLERALDRVGARAAQHGARGAAAREARRQRLEQRDLHRRRVHVAHRVHQPGCLLGDGGDHARVRVPGVRDAEAAAEVDEAVAVRVPDVRAGCALPTNGRLRHEAGDVAALDRRQPRRERARARAGHGGADLGQQRGRGAHGGGV